jgi:hypothetical protein
MITNISKAKNYANEPNALQCAEADTARDAFAFVVASTTPPASSALTWFVNLSDDERAVIGQQVAKDAVKMQVGVLNADPAAIEAEKKESSV